MTETDHPPTIWLDRAVERSAATQRTRVRIAAQVRQMIDAARRLIAANGDAFTTQDLVTEAGVAVQTFYRYFATKDEFLLAVIGDAMVDVCERFRHETAEISDPLDRLRFIVMSTLDRVSGDSQSAAMSHFVVSTRWRLHRVFPGELAEAERPYVELLRTEITAAVKAGLLSKPGTEWDPVFIAELVRAVYHHYAFAIYPEDEVDQTKERLWQFCLAGLGGLRATPHPTLKGATV